MRQQLLKLFKESGLSQSDFAKKAGITPSAFNDFLKERIKEFSTEKTRSVAKELGVNLHWFISGEGLPDADSGNLTEAEKQIWFEKMEEEEDFLRKIKRTEGAKEMFKEILELSAEEREIIYSLVKNFKSKKKKLKPTSTGV
ncbi:helix-turn-helix transcriptional regulator [Leptospira sp. 201903071]|uniref:helix-turn-helix domain-containing protein n=1 Tax=Leptospira ainazelensis TaxID=2810034 RepID=UPI00196650D8|nr:helix-turn-helix transcriptional regulator [Leptospira ainazelensis]MBM9499704.1 helix-turn-helix transcriptional regulator [Leptospira ainazelensis]